MNCPLNFMNCPYISGIHSASEWVHLNLERAKMFAKMRYTLGDQVAEGIVISTDCTFTEVPKLDNGG